VGVMDNIRVSTYIRSSSPNYGLNTIRLDLGDLTLWFSYQTVVAFQVGFDEKVVSENDWGPTTGKHLNAIDEGAKEMRLKRKAFEAKLQGILNEFGLVNPSVG
jgi:hypothetical protein